MGRNDMFANIASAGIDGAGKGLIIPEPPQLKEKYLKMDDIESYAAFELLPKMSERKELYEEVERQKAYYQPFFVDYSPELESYRRNWKLKEFQWRIGTTEDIQNFTGVLNGEGEWTNLKIPHYGEPRGAAVTYYRTVFFLEKEDLNAGSVWITFKGVDYKAHVFMNGMLLGSHEGFFAPFEFDFSKAAKVGENILVVMVENDYIHMGSSSEYKGELLTGDKFYAATGLGYDDPLEGWHHCPPGMGIYQDVHIETRSDMFVQDIFVRPLLNEEKAEVWLEIYSCKTENRECLVDLSIYGRNFEEIVLEHFLYKPETYATVGMGDSLTEAKMEAAGVLGNKIPMLMGKGINYLKISVPINEPKVWELDTPWLYQVQVTLLGSGEHCLDTAERHFGMRSFHMDTESIPKGKFYLNDRQIRLRGANTMGHEQQCVFKEDWDQLLTDLILAKVCNMNFLRLTQRPVQTEIYDFCDKIGLMIQTDLPLFGTMRRNQFAEGIKQVQEMEHLIRNHPCTVIVSYINEPMPNAKNSPHRGLERTELESFFQCADLALAILNPDRVIKHVDGDYDPPTEGYPDNHCYPCWYNGHGIDIGRLHKGYWMYVKDDWHYGCGEFGIEGLECVDVMQKYYPKEWLPQTDEEEKIWSPNALEGAQTGNFHYFFYDTQHSLVDWVRESQKYQAQSVALMTQAYRRDRRMNSFAYHLFIDAFPSGWMKTLMDVDRNPKKAYFAYRDALSPVITNLRTDRRQVFSGEKLPVEAWICNDTNEVYEGARIQVQVIREHTLLVAYESIAEIVACDSIFQGYVMVEIPKIEKREKIMIQMRVKDANGSTLHDTELILEAFPKEKIPVMRVCVLGELGERFIELQEDLQWKRISLQEVGPCDSILIVDIEKYLKAEQEVLEKVKIGAKAVFSEMPQGEYVVGGYKVFVQNCGMLPLNFVSINTGHPITEGWEQEDIKYWYDSQEEYVTPLLERTFEAEGFREILTSGNQDNTGNWNKVLAAGEVSYGKGSIYICQLKVAGRTKHNPVARQLAVRLLN